MQEHLQNKVLATKPQLQLGLLSVIIHSFSGETIFCEGGEWCKNLDLKTRAYRLLQELNFGIHKNALLQT